MRSGRIEGGYKKTQIFISDLDSLGQIEYTRCTICSNYYSGKSLQRHMKLCGKKHVGLHKRD